MKIFAKLMMLLLVLAVAGPFLLKGPDGKPFMSIKDLGLPSFDLSWLKPSSDTPLPLPTQDPQAPMIQWSDGSRQKQTINGSTENPVAARANVYYRWQDQNGVWQITATPQPNVENIIVSVDPNANVIQSMSKKDIDKAFGRQEVIENDADQLLTEKPPEVPESGFPMTVPLEQIPQLIDQAKGLQEMVDKRNEMMEKKL